MKIYRIIYQSFYIEDDEKDLQKKQKEKDKEYEI